MCNKPYVTADILANIQSNTKREQIIQILQSDNKTKSTEQEVILTPNR